MLFASAAVNAENSAIEQNNMVDPVVSELQAIAPASTTKETVQAQNQGPDDAALYVAEKAQEFVIQKRRKFAQQNKQVFMHSGTAIISVKPTEAGWGDARVMAYREAQQKARESMLKQLYVSVASETIRRSFKTNKLPEFTPEEIQSQSKLDAILTKLVALTDATLNTELAELGIDSTEFDAAPPTKRKEMMKKAITETVENCCPWRYYWLTNHENLRKNR